MKTAGILRLNRKKREEVLISTPQNPYFEAVSERFGILQVILYLSLLAFVVFAFLGNTELITYRNFYYFIKDLNASAETMSVFSNDAVNYPANEEQSFTLYRKGLAVAGNSAVTVFTATGRQTVSRNINYQNPVAVGSGKYLLVYELGGTQYSLYNSYTQIHTGTTEFAITGAAVSESGMYALVSSTQEYPSAVFLYSRNFSLINRYLKAGYVTGVAINKKGTAVAVLTSAPQGGSFSTSLMLCEPGATEAVSEEKIGDSVGLSCAFASSGQISVLCSGSVSFFSSDGKFLSEMSFDGKMITCAELGDDGAVLCLSSEGNSQKKWVIVFDKNGKVLYNEGRIGIIDAICRSGFSVYLQNSEGITRIRLPDGEEKFLSCSTDQTRILAVSENEVLLCSSKKAVYINFNS